MNLNRSSDLFRTNIKSIIIIRGKMYLTQVNKLRNIDKESFEILVLLSRLCKNMYNVGVYNVRQKFIFEGKYTNYFSNYHDCKYNENYKFLVQIGQNVLRSVDFSFRSFFELVKKKKEGIDLGKVNLPGYLDKNSYYPIIWQKQMFQVIDNKIRLSMTGEFKKKFNISKRFLFFDLPKHIDKNSIKEIKIVPRQKAKYFTIHITYKKKEIKNEHLNPDKFLSIDLGISNLASCIDSEGTSFIIDGKKLKSINQGFNKEIARLKSILDKQEPNSKRYSNRMYNVVEKRNNIVNEYLNLVTNKIITYCISNEIGNIVIGDLKDIQRNSKMGKINNQNFVQIPFSKLSTKIRNKCFLNSINIEYQEESYTSKCSFLDNEEIHKHDNYKGKRIKRGLFQSEKGILVNSDINGACNIMKKFLSKQNFKNEIFEKLSRGLVNSPLRIRIL